VDARHSRLSALSHFESACFGAGAVEKAMAMSSRKVFFGLVSVTAVSGAIIACTTTTTTVENPPADSGSGGDTGTGSKDSGPKTEQDTGTTLTGDELCLAESDRQACGQCCIKNHMTGYNTFIKSITDCACQGTGAADGGVAPCATECKDTFCKNPPAQVDKTCDTCLQNSVGQTGACIETVSKACQADTDCLAEQKCISGCPK
jgi:hypothetical protein